MVAGYIAVVLAVVLVTVIVIVVVVVVVIVVVVVVLLDVAVGLLSCVASWCTNDEAQHPSLSSPESHMHVFCQGPS